MHVKERAAAIQRAQRALKALGEHPRSSKKELGHAREHVNACYAHASGEHVWKQLPAEPPPELTHSHQSTSCS